MRLIYQHTPALPLTQIHLAVPRSGTCLDPPARQGLSRLMLRLMFLGADGLSNGEFNARLERLGAAAGFSLANGHFGLRLSTLSDRLDPALDLFQSAIHRPNFDAGEFRRLQGELTSGWMADRDESKQLRAQEVYLHGIYNGGPQGYLSDGLAAGLAESTLDDVTRQYRRLFGRGYAAGEEPLLAVLSNLSLAEVEARVGSRLSLPATEKSAENGSQNNTENGGEPSAPYPWDGFEPPKMTERTVTIVADEGTNTDEVLLGAFSVPQTDPDWHLHCLISLIFGGDMNSRLFRVIRGERALYSGASCSYDTRGGRIPPTRRCAPTSPIEGEVRWAGKPWLSLAGPIEGEVR